MISDEYEIYHVKDVVSQQKTQYHYHEHYEIHATLQGKATFYLEGKEFSIEPGTILLIHPKDVHRIMTQTTTVFERIYIFVTPAFLEEHSTKWSNLTACFNLVGNLRSKVLKIEPEKLAQLLAFADDKPDPLMYGEDIQYEQQLLNYFIFLNRLTQEEHEVKATKAVQNSRVKQMMDYVAKHVANPLTLEEMEKNFFVSKYYITREFKKHTGFTFHQYVMKRKLFYAKQLLKEYQSANAVYEKCGFTSYTHFLKAFKREFKMTPKEFIMKDRENQYIHFEHFEE
ncbi:MAG: AraC family transcriptional regulator [Enterococcus sp.]